MADIPRDPRQLARDILAGKISIEELAREQARRGGATGGARVGGPPPQQVRVPDRIPLPRPAPVQQPTPRPVARPVPPPIPQRPTPRPPVVITAPSRRPLQQPVKPVVTVRETPPVAPETRVGGRGEIPAVSKATSQTTGGAGAGAKLEVGKIMKNRMALRQCIVMAEVLGKPVALREE
ncbi:MAG: hypothetical protein FWD61_08820 [Phycisphaerales bacterium]|nr:hypothetical protein [Phycisphaerales bacterium]